MIYRVGQDKKTRQDKTEFLADEISFAGWHWMALGGTQLVFLAVVSLSLLG